MKSIQNMEDEKKEMEMNKEELNINKETNENVMKKKTEEFKEKMIETIGTVAMEFEGQEKFQIMKSPAQRKIENKIKEEVPKMKSLSEISKEEKKKFILEQNKEKEKNENQEDNSQLKKKAVGRPKKEASPNVINLTEKLGENDNNA